jgi:hypothetical protein
MLPLISILYSKTPKYIHKCAFLLTSREMLPQDTCWVWPSTELAQLYYSFKQGICGLLIPVTHLNHNLIFPKYFLFSHTRFIHASYPETYYPWMKIVTVFVLLTLFQPRWEVEEKELGFFFPQKRNHFEVSYLREVPTNSSAHRFPLSS